MAGVNRSSRASGRTLKNVGIARDPGMERMLPGRRRVTQRGLDAFRDCEYPTADPFDQRAFFVTDEECNSW